MLGDGKLKDDKNRSILTNPAIALGTNLTAGMLFFSGIGYYVDHRRGDGQAWTLVGMFLGLLWCGYEVWKLVRFQETKNRAEEAEKSDGEA